MTKLAFPTLNNYQCKEIIDLINEFAYLFATVPADFWKAKGVTHTIYTGDALPFYKYPYLKSCTEEDIIAAELKLLQDKGFIGPSSSSWASPILLIKKKDGGYRIVIDYFQLNMLTKKDSYPLLCVYNTLKQLRGSKYSLALGLASGYCQIKLGEK